MNNLNENCTARRVSKRYEIELDNGEVLHFTKWCDQFVFPFGSDMDIDWEWNSDRDIRIFSILDVYLQRKIKDFIENIRLF